MALSLRDSGNRPGMPLEEAMPRLPELSEGPVLPVEPSDDVGVGAPGDSTRVLRALVERGVPKAGVVISDPETVAALGYARSGERHKVVVGG